MLSTTDLLSKLLPDLAAQLPNGDKITIDMMLTHTSGLHDYFDVPTKDGTTIEDGAKDKAMLTRRFTPEELVQVVADSGLSYFEPGAEGQWQYSNTGYILLGLIIEKATGKSYEENLRTRIFEPLGLKRTYLQTGQPEAGALPQGYYKSPFDFTTGEWNASQGWAAGAVVSTPDEFARFLKALFTGQLFQRPETLDLMRQAPASVVDPLGPGTIYAHGMLDNNGVLGHGGQTLDFQSDGGYIPGKDVTVVTYAKGLEISMKAAEDLAKEGIEVEVGRRTPVRARIDSAPWETDWSRSAAPRAAGATGARDPGRSGCASGSPPRSSTTPCASWSGGSTSTRCAKRRAAPTSTSAGASTAPRPS